MKTWTKIRVAFALLCLIAACLVWPFSETAALILAVAFVAIYIYWNFAGAILHPPKQDDYPPQDIY